MQQNINEKDTLKVFWQGSLAGQENYLYLRQLLKKLISKFFWLNQASETLCLSF